MEKKTDNCKKNGVGFVLSLSFLLWMIFLIRTMVVKEWQTGITGIICLGVLVGISLALTGMYGHRLWTVLDAWWTIRLQNRYRKRYRPHADDELYLRKAYNDTVSLAATLYPFFLGKSLSVKAEILYELLEQLEKKQKPPQ